MSARRRAERPIVVARAGGVATITLVRGRQGNTLDGPALGALGEAAESIRLDGDVRVVVLAGEGRDFCRGLARPAAGPDARVADEAVETVARIEQPIVCATHGRVEGLGLALALAADLIVADPSARFVAGDPASGRLAGGGIAQRLTRAVGPGRATAMLLLGSRVGQREALAWGLAQRSAPAGRARSVATTLARALARQGPLALRYAKEACRRAADLPLDQGVRLEHDLYVLLQTTADRREGVAAFQAGRPPRFVGR